jgi:uncharacterized protein with von Willebrand factor type A (vWA) domain
MSGTLNVYRLAASARVRPEVMQQLLREDEQRGLVEEVAAGRWRATPAAIDSFGAAFRLLQSPNEGSMA